VSEEAAAKYADAAPPDPTQHESVTVPPPAAPAEDVVIASAEERPWWLKPYEIRAEPQPTDAIPIPSAEPTEGDRAAAALTAVWLGGSALAAVAEPPSAVEDKEQWPPREPDEGGGDE
jgi:hypothetical protein